jgi:hypothetical protein
MAFSEDLVTYLKTKTSITDLVGTGANARIRPTVLKQGDAYPAIRYYIGSGGSAELLAGGLAGMREPNLQVDCYATTRKQAESLADAVQIALVGYRGLMGTTYVSSISKQSRGELFEEPIDASDTGAYREMLQFVVFHHEATS